VVHITPAIAGLVGALLVGKRTGYGKDLNGPHSLTMSMIGASLLWVGCSASMRDRTSSHWRARSR